ncbi:MAG TPA: response regulator [Sphingomicrobium sp.]|nr:response regulator [Sphingomicrobium sp.]
MASSRPAALIVEDQPFVALVASDILEEAGFEPLHACDATTALALLRAHPEIEVMVTDVSLGRADDGVELARSAALERPALKLVVTASSTLGLSSELPSGARLLHKPYASAELRALVAGMALLQPA